jgi:DNA-binding NarL/FixJ family response regulator
MRQMEEKRLTCVIVEDHRAVLDSVAAYLDFEGLEVVGRATDAAEGVRVITEQRPDVAVLDYRLPGTTGLDVARSIAVEAPNTAAVLFSGEATRAVVTEALDVGVRGIVLKESSPALLLRAIYTVAGGRRFIDPQLRRRR